ncbi:MAG: DUF1214 domain-containing protein [Myxococcota bacterium]
MSDDRRRLLEGEAWEAFCDRLREAGRFVHEFPLPDSPELRAEGYRYLLGLLSSGIAQATALADPDRPRFVRNPDSLARWGAENADNQYLWARIRPVAQYRIHGRRESAYDFLVEVKQGYMQLGDAANYATVAAHELAVADDGRFELLLGPEAPAGFRGNFLPLHPDARYVAIRQYFYDWARESPARFTIECLDTAGPPPPLTPERMATLLDAASTWTLSTARFWGRWVEELRDGWRPDRLAPPRHVEGGAAAIAYGNDWWKLGPDEALLVECEVPDARYWAFQLCDPWFRTLEYASRQTSVNGAQAVLDADGRFRAVVAHRDPGVPNWLDTCGHPEGMIQYRTVWARQSPAPTARTLPFRGLAAALPADHPRISPEERRRQLRAREAHLQRREPAT